MHLRSLEGCIAIVERLYIYTFSQINTTSADNGWHGWSTRQLNIQACHHYFYNNYPNSYWAIVSSTMTQEFLCTRSRGKKVFSKENDQISPKFQEENKSTSPYNMHMILKLWASNMPLVFLVGPPIFTQMWGFRILFYSFWGICQFF